MHDNSNDQHYIILFCEYAVSLSNDLIINITDTPAYSLLFHSLWTSQRYLDVGFPMCFIKDLQLWILFVSFSCFSPGFPLVADIMSAVNIHNYLIWGKLISGVLWRYNSRHIQCVMEIRSVSHSMCCGVTNQVTFNVLWKYAPGHVQYVVEIIHIYPTSHSMRCGNIIHVTFNMFSR